MGNLGGGEILVIMLVALLVLGPSKLPEAARQLGKAVAEFRKVSGGFQRELRAALDAETKPTPAAQVPSGVAAPDAKTTDTANTAPAVEPATPESGGSAPVDTSDSAP